MPDPVGPNSTTPSFVPGAANPTDPQPLVVAITGASGAIYARRLIEVLLQAGRDVHLLVSPAGALVLKQELGVSIDLEAFDPAALFDQQARCQGDASAEIQGSAPSVQASSSPACDAVPGRIHYHHYTNFMASVASGSHRTAGMVVCPCSGSTLSSVAHAAGTNLIHRAAEVHLKEGRKLILVPRETPLSIGYIDNLRKACEMGATVLPAMPGWYHGVQQISDLVDFIVARVLDQLNIDHTLIRRWGDEEVG